MVIEIIMSHLDFCIIENVRELRVKSAPYVDQVALAQRIGVSEGYIGNIENPKIKARYNIRMLGRVARALELTSYHDLLPAEVLPYDMVRIRLKIRKRHSKKHEIDENGNVIRGFDIISITPLSEKELALWEKGELPYKAIIES